MNLTRHLILLAVPAVLAAGCAGVEDSELAASEQSALGKKPPPDCPTAEFCDAVCAGEEPPEIPPGCPTPLCACDNFCGGFAGLVCPEELVCVDFLGDDCDPTTTGADCIGVCVSAPTDSCVDHCGGASEDGSCWCDDLCKLYGDCCADFAAACERTVATGMCVRNSLDECATDADCRPGGCGGELCYNPAVSDGITTCDCTAPEGPTCGCVAGTCAWFN